jgi:hypothetical protein
LDKLLGHIFAPNKCTIQFRQFQFLSSNCSCNKNASRTICRLSIIEQKLHVPNLSSWELYAQPSILKQALKKITSFWYSCCSGSNPLLSRFSSFSVLFQDLLIQVKCIFIKDPQCPGHMAGALNPCLIFSSSVSLLLFKFWTTCKLVNAFYLLKKQMFLIYWWNQTPQPEEESKTNRAKNKIKYNIHIDTSLGLLSKDLLSGIRDKNLLILNFEMKFKFRTHYFSFDQKNEVRINSQN